MTLSKSDAFANDLLDMIRQATTESECKAISDKHEKHFARLQKVNPARAIHVVNLMRRKRIEFAEALERENQEQADFFR